MDERKIDLAMLSILDTPIEDPIIFKWAEQQLGDEQKLQKFQQAYLQKKKSKSTAQLLNLLALIGIGGIHRFYLGDIVLGIAHLVTFGFCWIGTLVDIFKITPNVNKGNVRIAMQIVEVTRLL